MRVLSIPLFVASIVLVASTVHADWLLSPNGNAALKVTFSPLAKRVLLHDTHGSTAAQRQLAAEAVMSNLQNQSLPPRVHIILGKKTSQPIGHYELCKRNPLECVVISLDATPLQLTAALWKQIQDVNKSVNRSVRPINDRDVYGQEEFWTYPNGQGDCEDYVLAKRLALSKAGIPLSNLLITVVRKRDGEGHAVLLIRTNRGDFVLDNLSNAVKASNQTPYTYLKIQDPFHTGRWRDILIPPAAPLTVAASR